MTDLSSQYEQDYLLDEEARLQRIKARDAEIATMLGELQPQSSPVQSPSSTPAAKPSGHSIGQHLSEIPKAIASGVGKAVTNTADALDELWDLGAQHWETLHEALPDVPLSTGSEFELPTANIETGTGRVTESITQFLTAFIPASRALKAVGTTAKFASALTNPVVNGLAAGAVADFAAFDPTEARVATAIQSLAPEVQMPFLSWLASTDPEDSLEGRMKNVIEGAGLGVAGDMFFRAAKGLKASFGRKPEGLDEVVGAVEQSKTTVGDVIDAMKKKKEEEATLREAYDHGAFFVRPPEEMVGQVVDALKSGKTFDDATEMFNFDYIDSPERIWSVVNAFNDHLPQMLKAKGFPMERSMDATYGAAEEYFKKNGITLSKELRGAVEGVKDLDVKATALRMLHVKSGQVLADLADKITLNSYTPADLIRFERQIALHAEIQGAAKAVQTTVGRTLNSYKLFANGRMVDADTLNMMLDSRGGVDKIRNVAARFKMLADPAARNKFVEKSWGAKTMEGIQFWWINSLLSAPTTWAINTLSNTAVAAMNVAESFVAATRNTITRKGELQFRDAIEQVQGMWLGLTESLRVSSEALKAAGEITTRGKVADRANLLTNPEHVGSAYQAFFRRVSTIDPSQSSKLDYDLELRTNAKGPLGLATKLIGFTVSTPTRVLMATDELFKTVHYRGYLHMLASKEARKHGFTGEARTQFIKDFMSGDTLSAAHAKEALDFAKKGTFQNDLGKAGRALQTIVQDVPAMRFIMPFVRTPTNIIKYAVHHSPLMAHPTLRKISTQMSEDIAAGGVRAELAQAKVATGTMLFGVASLLAMNGTLTNGIDPDMKYGGSAELEGIQRYSWKIGDKFYSFERTDPFGLFFGVTADLVSISQHMDEREWSETAGAVLACLSNNLTNKTYLKGLMDFTDAMMSQDSNPKKAERFMTNFVTSFIPNAMNQTNRIMDDNVIREVNQFMDAVMRRTPWSEQLMPKRDQLTGEEVHYKDGLLGGWVPVHISQKRDDPLRQELHRLDFVPKEVSGFYRGKDKRGNPLSVDLTPQEHDRLKVVATQEIKRGGMTLDEHLRKLVSTDYYKGLPDNGDQTAGYMTKTKLLNKVVKQYHEHAKQFIFNENPALRERFIMEATNRHNQIMRNGGN